jgi:hypothetical protein
MAVQRSLATFEAFAAAISFALIFATGLIGRLAVQMGADEKAVGVWVRVSVLLLFFVFGFALIGLMLHLFIAGQRGIGNSAAPMVRFLAAHEAKVTFAAWGFLAFGSLIALPFALHDLAGIDFRMPLRSKGVLVADIGMTFDDVRRASTLAVRDPRPNLDGSTRAIQDIVFDYQLPNSRIRFPQSRYYWLETGKKHDPRIVALNIGITPRKMPKPDLDTFQHKIQSDLLADGWMPGHYVANSEETVRLWGGKSTTGDGRYWNRGDTVLIFETNRMDDAENYILYLDLRPKSDEKDVIFEPSAWRP